MAQIWLLRVTVGATISQPAKAIYILFISRDDRNSFAGGRSIEYPALFLLPTNIRKDMVEDVTKTVGGRRWRETNLEGFPPTKWFASGQTYRAR